MRFRAGGEGQTFFQCLEDLGRWQLKMNVRAFHIVRLRQQREGFVDIVDNIRIISKVALLVLFDRWYWIIRQRLLFLLWHQPEANGLAVHLVEYLRQWARERTSIRFFPCRKPTLLRTKRTQLNLRVFQLAQDRSKWDSSQNMRRAAQMIEEDSWSTKKRQSSSSSSTIRRLTYCSRGAPVMPRLAFGKYRGADRWETDSNQQPSFLVKERLNQITVQFPCTVTNNKSRERESGWFCLSEPASLGRAMAVVGEPKKNKVDFHFNLVNPSTFKSSVFLSTIK